MSVNMRDIVRRIIAKLGLNFTEGSARGKRSPFAQRTVKNGQLVHTLTGQAQYIRSRSARTADTSLQDPRIEL